MKEKSAKKRWLWFAVPVVFIALAVVLALLAYANKPVDPYKEALQYAAKNATSVRQYEGAFDAAAANRLESEVEARRLAKQLYDGLGGNEATFISTPAGASAEHLVFYEEDRELIRVSCLPGTNSVYLMLPDHTTYTDDPFLRTNGQLYQCADRGAFLAAFRTAMEGVAVIP